MEEFGTGGGGGGGGGRYFLNVGLLFKKMVEEMEIMFLECTKHC